MEKYSDNFEENVKYFGELVQPDKNFDMIVKKIKIAGKKATLFMIDSFTKDELMEKLLEYFSDLKEDDIPGSADEMADLIPYIEVDVEYSPVKSIVPLMQGMVVMFLEGFDNVFLIDCRTYPSRSVSEPWKNRVLRGSRDGFVESIAGNVGLIRRRVRTKDFRVEALSAGRLSKTDIAIAYIEGLADKRLLDNIKKRIKTINVDALTMNIESLAETLLKGSYINPFPKFKYTERSDSAAAAVFDGNIVVLIDNSPAVMILPTSIFDIAEEADDYYFPPVTGTYLKLSRYCIAVFSLILTPVWVLLLNNPGSVPEWLKFVLIEEHSSTVPVLLQLFILEFAIDGLKMAAVNTPNMLTTPLSIVAGIVFGDYTVDSGWFNPEIMLYMAFVAVANYTQSNMELTYAVKFHRIILLILTSIFGICGFIAGTVIFAISLLMTHTLLGEGYLYPIIPFDGRCLMRRFFRMSLPAYEKTHR